MRTLAFITVAAALFAQPKLENAKLQTRAVTGSLDATFRTLVSSQTEPAWIGYSVAQTPGERGMCGTISLEGAPQFLILYRVVAGQVEKIRTYATDCTFDAGDLPFYWLNGVDGAQSAALLATFIPPELSKDSNRDKKNAINQLANSALSAIARHRDGVSTLIELARRQQVPQQFKQEAMRWLGRSKDPRAVKFFEEILAAR